MKATVTRCRFCGTELKHSFVDLGMSPPCESYVTAAQLFEMEAFYPLHVFVCHHCFLVQLPEHLSPAAIFSNYAYFSSYSDSWLDHARRYTETVNARFGLNSQSQVVEIASNDGYLLQYFVARNIPALGIEPAANIARVAEEKGIPTVVKFFGEKTALELLESGHAADLLVGNNVLAHVPDINDFVGGLKILLKPGGVITMEFPHLLRLMAENQFDTIYHEHYSYLSFTVVNRIFEAHGLTLFDVEELPTHGGSLRIYARHTENPARPVLPAVSELLRREKYAGVEQLEIYASFTEQVKETKRKLLGFLVETKNAGKSVVGYGAPGKGNTLLNYCGIRSDFLDYTVDRSPYKQGLFLPGTHIPIYHPDRLRETRPNYILILPWNLQKEIVGQLSYVREWGGRFVIPIPQVQVLD